MRKILVTILSLLPLLVSAEAVEIDGIWYNLVKKAKSAEVIRNPSDSQYYGSYSFAITIPDKVTFENVEYNVTSIDEEAFAYCYALKSVTLPNSVTSIKKNAFRECDNLSSLNLPANLTEIGETAFLRDKNLKTVEIPDGVKSIGSNAFAECTSFTHLIIPNSVTFIDQYAFVDCSGLKYVTLSNALTELSYGIFQGCSGITSIDIPQGVKTLQDAFKDCTGLESVTIPNSVEFIKWGAFENCSSLISVTIPNSVTSINGNAFFNCKKLTTITIGNGIKHIDKKAFAQCPELTDVYCLVEEISSTDNFEALYTSVSAFDDSFIEYATLHIPESAINDYKTLEPWNGFGKFKTLTSEEIEIPKCATPTINFENGIIKFSCETEGVEFVSNISTADTKDYHDAELTLTYKYKVTVYATKDGYENSDTVTAEFTANGKFGDLNGDGIINVADHVKLSDIIMNQ